MLDGFFDKFPFRRKLTRDRFARLLLKRLRSADGVTSVRYEPEHFRLFVDGEQYVNLANFYDEYLRLKPAEREHHVENILQSVFLSGFKLPDDFEDAKHDLMPKIWPRAAFDRLDLQAAVDGSQPSKFATLPVGDHFYLGLVYDLPKSVRTIGAEELEKWNVTLSEALEIAIANLRSHPMKVSCLLPKEEGAADENAVEETGNFLPPREYDGIESENELAPDGRVYIFMSGDSFDATRMILLDGLSELETAGRPVALAPNRDILLVAGEGDEMALAALAAFASQMYENEPRPHVPIPLVSNGQGAWSEYHVDAAHAAYDDLHALEVKYLAEEYSEQKPLLEKLYAEQYLRGQYLRETRSAEDDEQLKPSPPFIASLLVAEASDGSFESHAVWPEDQATLLPKADVVAFMKQAEGAAPIQIPWSDVMAVLDDLVYELPDHYPPRFQVAEFPSDLALRILSEDQE